MKKPVRILFTILCIVFVGVFLFSGYKIVSKLYEYKVAEKTYDDLSQKYVSSKPASSASSSNPVNPTENSHEVILDDEISPIEVDFKALVEQNSDVVGWIYSPDTVVNYPVVQCDDNMYYLHRLINGNYNASGTLFVECQSPRNFQCDNSIIYGHHMNDGTMFASLVDYSYQDYYDKHPTMYINTPNMNYRVELFAGYVTAATLDVYTISFEGNEDAFKKYIDNVKSMSKFKSNVDIKPGDKIVTLSTCTYDYDEARFVVQGKLVPIH